MRRFTLILGGVSVAARAAQAQTSWLSIDIFKPMQVTARIGGAGDPAVAAAAAAQHYGGAGPLAVDRQIASFAECRATLDATDPLTFDRFWLYRINTLFQLIPPSKILISPLKGA